VDSSSCLARYRSRGYRVRKPDICCLLSTIRP
jgi:hypothetical protein